MKKLLLLGFLISFAANAQFRCQEIKHLHTKTASSTANNNSRSDTADILHYHLDLDLTDISNRNLAGSCQITFTPRINNLNELALDLLKLNTDSVIFNGNPLSFTHTGEKLTIDLGAAYSPQDTLQLTVHYSGIPAEDQSGWGGFHTQSGYYYNLGVGFAADPHTYGRAWFPCFDNFVEHSTYSFAIKTQQNHRAFCNGLETANTVDGNGHRLTEWNMEDPIPTYLASVAVSNYIDTTYTVNVPGGQVPVQLVSKPSEQSQMVYSFSGLDNTLLSFIDHFGEYRWQKVGYVLTPKGAMEHATSIHFPVSLVQNLSGEDIMAHELAHHWWGNLVTCESADDMWINEGMAEYCSHLYLEDLYGRGPYLEEVQANAYKVINNAHVQDNGYRPIYAPPHEYVYGFHVYQKGAMVAHNLRAYMGDNLFFSSLKTLLDNNAFQNISTQEFRDELSQISGMNLNDFFDSWIYNAGFPSVAVQELNSTPSNSVNIKVVQRKHKAPGTFNGLPVEVTFFSSSGDTTNRVIKMTSDTTTANFQLPFTPVFALASYSGKLLTADTYDEFILDQPTIYRDNYGKMRLQVHSLTDTAKVIVTHHYAGPDGKAPANADYRISNSRYWTVRGFDMQNADVSGVLYYDGTTNGYDADLLGASEDSIMVLYRPNPQTEWTLYPHQNKRGASGAFNKLGTIEIDQLQEGDYVFANTAETIGIKEDDHRGGRLQIFPNPVRDEINIDFGQIGAGTYQISISSIGGQILYDAEHLITDISQKLRIPLDEIGYVLVQVNGETKKILLQ